MKKNSELEINGKFITYSGTDISVEEDAVLKLGNSFINKNSNISCFKKIEIGNNCIISENVTIRDSDNHKILREGYEKSKEIVINDNVWVGINATILKGVHIGKGSIIAAGSVVTEDIPEGCLAAGIPAKVIKKNIKWER